MKGPVQRFYEEARSQGTSLLTPYTTYDIEVKPLSGRCSRTNSDTLQDTIPRKKKIQRIES